MNTDTETMFFVLFVVKNGKMIIPSTRPAMPSEAPLQPSPNGESSFLLRLRRLNEVLSPCGRLGWGSSGLDGPLVELLPFGEGWDGASPGNSVGVAFRRRRYTQSDNMYQQISAHQPGAGNACG